jgi:hypothetical protein
MMHCKHYILIWSLSMDDVIDRIMNSQDIDVISDNRTLEEIRAKIVNYIATLSSAGKSDADELIECGLAYLRELHEAPDPRYTGC